MAEYETTAKEPSKSFLYLSVSWRVTYDFLEILMWKLSTT